MRRLLLLALFGLIAQFIDGSLGMAYGVTSTSLLLLAGLAPAAASASVHLSEVGTTLVSGAAHWGFGNVDWRLVARLGAPGAVGAFVGATALSSLSTESAKPLTAGILLVLGLYILGRFMAGGVSRKTYAETHHFGARFLLPLGVLAGFVDATGGGGWGPVSTTVLLVRDKIEPRRVIGSVDASEFLVAVAASVGFLLSLGSSGASLQVAAALFAGGLIAAPFAAWVVRHVNPRLLGVSVGGILVVTNMRTIFGTFAVVPGVQVWCYALVLLAWGATLAIGVRKYLLEKAHR